ncbi:MAG: TerB N-terminal domain-containing protein [Planctomycetaceae bacterium]|nr:TerB N-terminal domain-containing protein [Planctomycetales bacterium]MCB9923057.1 TerB N-terminal domain-containing protein [Planctomycetaceae bacterium]
MEPPPVASNFEQMDRDEDEGFPLPAMLVCIGGAHIVIFVILAIFSPGLAFVLVGLAIVVEIAIWKRKELTAFFQHVQQSETTKQILDQAKSRATSGVAMAHSLLSEPRTPPRRSEIVTAEVISELDDSLVEIRPAKPAQSRPRTVSHIGHPDPRRERPSMSGTLGGRPLEAKLPKDNVYFYGPGSELDLGRGVLKWPLVYATGAPQRGNFDASLIDGTLPIAPPGSPVDERLPYWPNYYDCSPTQRAHYLDWLLAGKSDPDTELGYVFIYFYGLERRVLVDQADHIPIAQELIRLLPIYDRSNSFRRYTSTLLWLTLYLASQSTTVPQTLLNEAIAVTGRWNDELLGMCLAILYNSNQPLPAHVAFLVSQNDSRSSSSVIVRRHRDEFAKLFETKYRGHFGDGIQLRASKRLKRIDYHPASGTLMRNLGAIDGLSLPAMPDILAISSQFKQIVQSWDESIEELKAYSRASRSAGGELTADAYEALPTELQEGDHPELDAWMQAWEENVDDEGWPIVPVSAIASIKGIPARDRLTKTQCRNLLRTADVIGLGIEPDARMTGKDYRWDERVTLFFLDDENGDDATSYIAASALLRLGASVAEADGQVDKDELAFITDHLEGQFNLSDGDSKRLERLQYLLLHSRSGDNTISKMLAKRLPRQHRLLVGEFLVGVAAVDELITKDEIKALRKAYKSLDLDAADLDKLIARHAVQETDEATAAPQDAELRLDMLAISRIMTETRQVAGILRDAMAEDDEPESSSGYSAATRTAVADPPAVKPTSTSIAQPHTDDTDLDFRFRPFLAAVLERDEWTPAELRELADKCHIMMSGAVESINEWSTERYGDWIIEEGDAYHVRLDLIEESD